RRRGLPAEAHQPHGVALQGTGLSGIAAKARTSRQRQGAARAGELGSRASVQRASRYPISARAVRKNGIARSARGGTGGRNQQPAGVLHQPPENGQDQPRTSGGGVSQQPVTGSDEALGARLEPTRRNEPRARPNR